MYPLLPATFEYRWAVGFITAAALDANDAYLLTNFPLQLDQLSRLVIPWGPPEDGDTQYPARTAYGEYGDQTQWSDGPLKFMWSLAHLTEFMVTYIENYGWSGGLETKPSTVKTLKHNGAFGYYHCYANKPQGPNVGFKRGYQGLDFYKIPFVGAIEIYP